MHRWIATGMVLASLTFLDRIALADIGGPPPPPLPVTVEEEFPRTLDGILAAWLEASRDFGPATTDFTLIVYDHVFEIEKRCRGTYSYEGPFVFRAEFRPVPIRPGDVAGMQNSSGEPYKLVLGNAEEWWADGTRLGFVDENENAKEVVARDHRSGPHSSPRAAANSERVGAIQQDRRAARSPRLPHAGDSHSRPGGTKATIYSVDDWRAEQDR